MAVDDGHIARVTVRFVPPADTEDGVGVEAVHAIIASGEVLHDDLVEELDRAKKGDCVERPDQDIVVEMHVCHTAAEKIQPMP